MRWIARLLAIALTPISAVCQTPPPNVTVDQEALANPSFGVGSEGEVPSGWQIRGQEYGSADWTAEPSVSDPGALLLQASSRGSTGSNSLMVFQELDPTPYRGRTVRFGARVRTEGAGVNLVLYTPQRSANELVDDPAIQAFEVREGTLEVPEDAEFLSFGIQLFGREGSRAWIDDAFIAVEGADPPQAEALSSARVVVDVAEPSHRLSPMVFGMHIEWIADGQGLLEEGQRELRGEVIDLLEPLGVPLFRFPGGIHADYYDWELGVGEDRGRSPDVFSGRRERHRFGSPEFLDLLERTGAQALITANAGTGTPAMAEAWARWFDRNGHQVRHWEVGNELYLVDPSADIPNGSAIHVPPEEYARSFPEYRSRIRSVVPEAQVGIIGHIDTGAFPLAPAGNRDWTQRMLEELDVRADFIAVHNAYAPVIIADPPDLLRADRRLDVYRGMYAAADEVRENLDQVAAMVARLSPANAGIPLAVTEFGPFFGLSSRQDVHSQFVDQSRTMAAALYVASVLNVFLENPSVTMAAYTNPIHEWFGSLITDTPQGLVRTPTYHLYRMYRERLEDWVLPTDVVGGPSFDAPTIGIVKARAGVSYLHAIATSDDAAGRVSIMLVNRHPSDAVEADLDLGDFRPAGATCMALSAEDPSAVNTSPMGRSTRSVSSEIAPRSVSCEAGSGLRVNVPANGILSVVLEAA